MQYRHAQWKNRNQRLLKELTVSNVQFLQTLSVIKPKGKYESHST